MYSLPVFALRGHTVFGAGNLWHKQSGFLTLSLADKQALSATVIALLTFAALCCY
jgi:hypothetical protein